MNKKTFKRAFIDSLPIMAGYIIMGMGFGVLIQKEGYNFLWSGIMGLTILGGSMQYVAVDLLGGAVSFLTTAVMTIMINGRYFFYGLSMLEKYRQVKKGRWYLQFALTDETYSLVSTMDTSKPENKGVHLHAYYFLLSALNHCYWIIGCVSGALLGGLANFDSRGKEFAMTALFVTIFVDQWREENNHYSEIFGVAISLIFILILGADNFVIPAMLVLTVVLMSGKVGQPKEEDYE